MHVCVRARERERERGIFKDVLSTHYLNLTSFLALTQPLAIEQHFPPSASPFQWHFLKRRLRKLLQSEESSSRILTFSSNSVFSLEFLFAFAVNFLTFSTIGCCSLASPLRQLTKVSSPLHKHQSASPGFACFRLRQGLYRLSIASTPLPSLSVLRPSVYVKSLCWS